MDTIISGVVALVPLYIPNETRLYENCCVSAPWQGRDHSMLRYLTRIISRGDGRRCLQPSNQQARARAHNYCVLL